MAESYINKGNIYITLKDNEGYIVRHKFYSGAYFCINFDGTVTMATGARMHFKSKDWKEIQDALNEGSQYMSRFILLGCTTFNHKGSKTEQVKSGYLYQNHQGKGVFVKKLNDGRYLEIIFSDKSTVFKAEIKNQVLKLYTSLSYGCVERVRVRKSKPTKLLKCLSYIGVDFDTVEILYNGDVYYRKSVKELQNVL